MGVFDDDTVSPPRKARTKAWRFTNVNASYEYCPTYPAALVVPSKISNATLNYGRAYRSKHRIPGLVYLHWNNLGSITRASQPMVGLKNARSIQDEKLIEAVFTSHSYHHYSVNTNNPSDPTSRPSADMANASYIVHSGHVYGATPTNLIIDARPTTNAMANVAKGAGTENMEYYKNCKKVYLGIDNIHVMRDSLARVAEAIRQSEATNYDLLRRSGWLKHLSCILEGIVIIVKAVHLANSHVLVHCSDGWDRTSQLSSLSQLCLDPYYRTMEGFAVLVEKDWVSFGHRFLDRYGHVVASRVQFVSTPFNDQDEGDSEVGFLASMQQRLNFSGSSHAFKETSPVFDQFLDTIHQLQRQFPERFEYNDQFLLELQRQIYECKYGNFLFNSERDRAEAGVQQRTRSIWSDLLSPQSRGKYVNPAYVGNDDNEVLFPDPKDVRWWTTWFKRPDMNAEPAPLTVIPPEPTIVEGRQDDPVLRNVIPPLSDPYPSARSPSQSSPSTSSSPPPSGLPISLDSATMAQASTAVQGAMRSAWSAWKSVRQGYDGVVKEMTEAAPRNDSLFSTSVNGGSSSALPSRSHSPVNVAVPAYGEYRYTPRVPRSPQKSPQLQPAPSHPAAIPQWPMHEDTLSSSASLSPQGNANTSTTEERPTVGLKEPSTTVQPSPGTEQELESNPWKGGDGGGDPLGVSVWS